jgi:hypothetical protein
MKRQIVQVSAASGDVICAACNDGTAWAFYKAAWVKLPPIPQDPESKEVTELRKFVEGNGDDRP